MSVAVDEATENVSTPPAKVRDYSHLRAYQFKKGQRVQGCGRPKGRKNATTILLESAPKLVRAYIKEGLKGNASILTDSRKWIMPVEEDKGSEERSTFQIIFAQLPVAELPTPEQSTPSGLTQPALSDVHQLLNQQTSPASDAP